MATQRGKYGTYETVRDEEISNECLDEILSYLNAFYPFENYSYKKLYDIEERIYYDRFKIKYDVPYDVRIKPDSCTILLVNDENINDFYPIITIEDKHQDTEGNAIERFAKNYNFYEGKMNRFSDINPYFIFFSGKSSQTAFMESKIRESLNVLDVCYHFNNPKSIYKKDWNLCYVKEKRFTKDEKMNALYNILPSILSFYKNNLNRLSKTYSEFLENLEK